MSYKVEIVECKDLTVQIEAIKSSIKDSFHNVLNKKKILSIRLL